MIGKMLLEALKHRGEAHEVRVSENQTQVTAYIEDGDRYSVALALLSVGGTSTVEDVAMFLSTRAAAIVRELSYLEEPLAQWEQDVTEGIAQLRSSPPQRENEEVSYWEVVLHASATPTATLARYRWAPGMPERAAAAYPLTFALVGRMADSLAVALAD